MDGNVSSHWLGFATAFVGRRLVFAVSRSAVCYSIVSACLVAARTDDSLKPTLHSPAGRRPSVPFPGPGDPSIGMHDMATPASVSISHLARPVGRAFHYHCTVSGFPALTSVRTIARPPLLRYVTLSPNSITPTSPKLPRAGKFRGSRRSGFTTAQQLPGSHFRTIARPLLRYVTTRDAPPAIADVNRQSVVELTSILLSDGSVQCACGFAEGTLIRRNRHDLLHSTFRLQLTRLLTRARRKTH